MSLVTDTVCGAGSGPGRESWGLAGSLMVNISVARARVKKKKAKNVLMEPCWVLLVVVIKGRLVDTTALGPDFSSHVWSTSCVAIYWPSAKPSLGGSR